MKECTRCGRCCKEEVCPLGLAFNESATEPCYALEFDGEIHSCGLVSNPTEHLPNVMNDRIKIMMGKYLEEIHGFGRGCDSTFYNEEPPC